MSFSIRLTEDLLSVEAGVTVPLNIEIANRDEEQDRFEMEVEGLDPEWTAVPVPTFSVDAGENHTEKVFFKPGRVSESLAGNYPFVVKIRSLVSGEQRTAQGVLQIKPYNHLTMEIAPKKGSVGPLKQDNAFTITLLNLGNTEHTVQLFANDLDDQCAFDFEHDQLSVSPGQQRTVAVTANPERTTLIASPRLHGFTVSARSLETPAVVASAQAQLEQKPLLSPGSLLSIVLLALIAFVWFLLSPKQPVVDSLTLDKTVVDKGGMVTVTWHASNAKGVAITISGKPFVDGPSLSGTKTFAADESGTVEAIAYRDSRKSGLATAEFKVLTPETIPDPRIISFDITPRNPKVGQNVTVRYKFNDSVTKATLAPVGLSLDPKVDTVQFKASDPGETTYYIVAENKDGKSEKSRSVKLNAQTVSAASVVVFRIEPNELEEGGGQVKITWQLANAVRAELFDGQQTVQLEDVKGEKMVDITQTTEFKLTGYDDKGMTVTQAKTAKVKKPPVSGTSGGNGDPASIGGGDGR